ncbi:MULTISPECIES: ABC transporter ATP-binding protein [Actinokineospora]|uniref:ABC transporter ATP-binding protein n=1 Tax=Actinokineospora fastidiosa TaxID=1816 RepID=A0A918LD90_9PSEU|nr:MULTISPECIES: ABC transporter ATP-binding protein [Actinokineospora]UVS79876.1 LIV-I protein F [Actinokineospora sp. UTMC 2448]GGS31452.1 ABC transporter ATP-binding protein [Actinokineospora fastidiosa]
MLDIDDLVTTYGPVRALDGLSLWTQDASITAVLGPNGAGKTTLLRTISGLAKPTSGRVRFDDTDITGWSPDRIVRMGLAHVPENGGVITELTVAENLRLGGLWRRDKAGVSASMTQVLELFPPLVTRLKSQASTLSGGERQMLAIGRALMSKPRMLLLDEPSLGLAPGVTLQIMRVLEELRDWDELTVLLVEQNARSALSIADRGYVLSLGRVVAVEEAEGLLADDRLRHAYLGM